MSVPGPGDDWRQPRSTPVPDWRTVATLDALDTITAARDIPAPVPDAEQEAALAILQRELFVDLSGTAGVGKTFVARLLTERMDGVELCATTGIAAVNLGEGTTINGLLHYYNTDTLREQFMQGYLQSTLKGLRRAGLRRILLDEKSMLDAHQLTMLVRAIDEVNQGRTLSDVGTDSESERETREAPEPIGLILVGDFGQLPPVKAPFAFESAEWQRFADHRVSLTTIRRQADQPFIQALRYIRSGDVTDALTYFTEDKFSATTDDQFDGTTIFAKNDAVDRYNQLRLDQVQGRGLTFPSTRWGKQSPEWKDIPAILNLKVGALVMILANRRYPAMDADERPALMYANGDLGVIVDVVNAQDPQTCRVMVQLKRTGRVVPVWMVQRECLAPLEPGRRQELREVTLSGRPLQPGEPMDKIKEKYEIVGTVVYMPLRLAYGTTVHKSQGLTLDNVQVNIGDNFFGKPSMLFVALSRARSPQGLRIVGSQRTFVHRCATNPLVRPWL
jgi:ATP-dependent DNA helicase PIF1